MHDAGDGQVKIANGRTGTYLIQLLVSGAADDAHVALGPATSFTAEIGTTWKLALQADGSYTLAEPGEPHRVVTRNENGNLSLAAYTGAENQRWTFNGQPVTFRVGPRRLETSLPPGGSGFAVMAFDAALRPVTGILTVDGASVKVPSLPAAFVTNGVGALAGDDAALGKLLRGLAARPGTTVLLQSAGRPKPASSAWNDIAAGVAALGGDPSAFLQLDGTGDYVLAGYAGGRDQPVFNEMLRRQVNPEVTGARLDGILTRDGDSVLTATAATPAQLDATFGDLAARAPAAWPFDDGGEGTAVLDYIANKLSLTQTSVADIGPVRNAYCVRNVGAPTDWGAKKGDLGRLVYPGGTAGITCPRRRTSSPATRSSWPWPRTTPCRTGTSMRPMPCSCAPASRLARSGTCGSSCCRPPSRFTSIRPCPQAGL